MGRLNAVGSSLSSFTVSKRGIVLPSLSFSGNTQKCDNKLLYKLLEVLLSSRLTVTECCASIHKNKHNNIL